MNPPVLFISKNTTYTNLCNNLRHGVHYDATIGKNVCNKSDYSATTSATSGKTRKSVKLQFYSSVDIRNSSNTV